MRRLDGKGQQGLGLRRPGQARAQLLREGRRILDEGVRRQQRHDSLRIPRPHQARGQRCRRRRVPLRRLGDDLPRGEQPGQRRPRAFQLGQIGQDKHMLAWHQPFEPPHRFLHQRAFGKQLEQVLRRALPAHRPEALAAAAGHDADIGVGKFLHQGGCWG